MSDKSYVPEGASAPASQIGASIEALARTIEARRAAGSESYTHRLLEGPSDAVLKKVVEEAGEVALAGKDVDVTAMALKIYAASSDEDERTRDMMVESDSGARDHLRYEAADVIYHLLVTLARYGVDVDDLAAELNERMEPAERPSGAVRLHERYIKRSL